MLLRGVRREVKHVVASVRDRESLTVWASVHTLNRDLPQGEGGREGGGGEGGEGGGREGVREGGGREGREGEEGGRGGRGVSE